MIAATGRYKFITVEQLGKKTTAKILLFFGDKSVSRNMEYGYMIRRKAKSNTVPIALLNEFLSFINMIELLMIGKERAYEIV